LKFGEGNLALDLFQQMHQEGVQLDLVIYVSVLDVSANIDAFEKWMMCYEQFIKASAS
jgi:pentatricopeptide repeat protein